MIGKDKQTASQAESLSGDEAGVARLLNSLPRVEASRDFDFKLKARIAQRRQNPDRGIGYLKILGIAAPLFLVLIAISIFIFRQPAAGDEVSQSASATSPQAQDLNPVSEKQVPSVQTIEIPTSPVDSHSALVSSSARPVAPKRNSPVRGGSRAGSFDTAVSPSDTILPHGFGGGPPIRKNNESPVQRTNIDIDDVLKLIGVSATPDASGWKVSNVSADSVSARSGIQQGDVIESLDNRKVFDGARIGGAMSIKKLVVKRGELKIEITLTPH